MTGRGSPVNWYDSVHGHMAKHQDFPEGVHDNFRSHAIELARKALLIMVMATGHDSTETSKVLTEVRNL